PTLVELADYLKNVRRIAVHKLPERLEIIEELPVTPTGKVQKFALRERARQLASASDNREMALGPQRLSSWPFERVRTRTSSIPATGCSSTGRRRTVPLGSTLLPYHPFFGPTRR